MASRRLSLEAILLVGASRLLLARRTTTDVLRLLSGAPRRARAPRRRHAEEAPGGETSLDPMAALLAVQGAGRRLGAPCLPQSVALASLLQRHGAEPVVVLGCRRHGTRAWGAHAWVELEGQRLEPLVQPDHAELARLTAAGAWQVMGP